MRQLGFSFPLLILAGCASNWTGDPWQDQFERVPYWPDCDRDGLGTPVIHDQIMTGGEFDFVTFDEESGRLERECDDQFDPTLPVPCEGGVWVKNNRDCDDTYALSGGTGPDGAFCPQDYAVVLDAFDTTGVPGIVSDDYQVLEETGADEVMIVRNHAVPFGMAELVCNDWALGANLPAPDGVPVVNTSPPIIELGPNDNSKRGALSDFIESQPDMRAWWVGVVPADFEGDAWAWATTGETNLGFNFCNGDPPVPSDVLTSIGWVDSDGDGPPDSEDFEGSNLADVFADLHLVLYGGQGNTPCLTYAHDPLVCPDQDSCFADIVCQRTRRIDTDYDVFQLLGDDTCLAQDNSAG